MDITGLKRGERGVVLAVLLPPKIKERLRSLNVRTGSVVRVLRISFFKRTYLLQAGGSRVALSGEAASCVQIRKV